jgi:hypothetical protein
MRVKMNLYDIDCEIERLENDLGTIDFNSSDEFLIYADKMESLKNLYKRRENKLTHSFNS